MTREELFQEALRFRLAIENARNGGEFTPNGRSRLERMSKFPYDCCDDTADLFTHYLYHVYGIDSIRIDSEYYDNVKKITCGHSWQETNGWLVDLTGDQFDSDPSIRIKSVAVYVGEMDDFHGQFKVYREERSCGIECLGESCHERMLHLYETIIKYMK